MTETIPPTRIFKIGSVRLVEDATLSGKSIAEIQHLLTPLYPQLENATVREHHDDTTGVTTYEWLPKPGRKG